MLWRLQLDGVDTGDRWEATAKIYEPVVDQAYMCFTDMHAMFAFMATGREAQARSLLAALEANLDGPTSSSLVIKAAGLPIVKGIYASVSYTHLDVYKRQGLMNTHWTMRKTASNLAARLPSFRVCSGCWPICRSASPRRGR